MELIRHGNEKLQSKEQKNKSYKNRGNLKETEVGYTKKLPEGTRKQKTVTNGIDKLKTRANETEYWKKYNDNNNTTNNKID